MPEVIRVPSIWDYIGGAASTGIENYQQAQERVNAEEGRNINYLSNLFNQGAIDNTDLMPALEKAGIKTKIQPNKEQTQRQILSSPDVNPATGKPWTFAERKIAGVPSKLDEMQEGNAINSETIKDKFLKGETLSEREAKFAGVPTDTELTLGRMQTENKVLGEKGTQYVDMALASTNGKVVGDWNKIVDRAFGLYVADAKRMGIAADPSHRAFFVTQIFDRMTDQKKLDLDAMNATTSRINATRPQLSAIDRQFSMMTGVVESRRKELNDYMDAAKNNIMLAPMLATPGQEKNPMVVEYKTGLATLQKNLVAAQNAQAQASSLTPQQRAALKIDEPQTGTSIAGADAVADNMASAIRNKKGTINDAQKLYATGKLTAAQYVRIKQLLGITDKPTR